MYTLKFAMMDAHGDLYEKLREEHIQEDDIRKAVDAAQAVLQKYRNSAGLPFMPELIDSNGNVVAATVSTPAPNAHRLMWIKGSAVNSPEEWVLA